MKIVDFSPLTPPFNLKIKNTTIPGLSSPFLNYTSWIVPATIKVLSITDAGVPGHLYLKMWWPGLENPYIGYFPADTDVDVLTDAENTAFNNQHRVWEIGGIRRYLHPGFSPIVWSAAGFLLEDSEGYAVDPGLASRGTAASLFGDNGSPIFKDRFEVVPDTRQGTCLDEHTQSLWNQLRAMYRYAFTNKVKISSRSILPVRPETLATAADTTVAIRREYGNAYGIGYPDLNPKEVLFRTAAGQMCINLQGYSSNILTKTTATDIVKAIDAIAGVASVSLFAGIDEPNRRRFAAPVGSYLLRDSLFSYPGFSNAWLVHPTIGYMLFDLFRKSIYMANGKFMDMWKSSEEEVVDVIQSTNVDRAREILKRNETLFTNIFQSVYGDEQRAKVAVGVFLKGATSILSTTERQSNWCFESMTDTSVHGFFRFRWAELYKHVLGGGLI
jgi:hypothetical protein